MLLEQVDDCEELTKFLQCEKWKIFTLENVYSDVFAKYPKRNIAIDKKDSGFF
jgi:hypothetical protein